MKNKLLPLLFLFCCSAQLCFAQDIEMADVMRSNGKIYVVVAVAAIVLFGMITYLIIIDRKLSRIEKEVDSKSKN